MQYYVASWAMRYFPPLRAHAAGLTTAALLMAGAFPLSIYLLRARFSAATELLAMACFVWAGVSVIAVSWAFFGDLVVLVARLSGGAEKTRRAVGMAVPIVVVALSAFAAWNASRLPRVKDAQVTMRGLPAGLEGMSLVQLTDLHLGVTVSPEKWEAIVDMVNALSPDVIVLSGDFVDPGIRDVARVESAGGRLKAKLAKVAVLGNHEIYHGAREAEGCFSRCGARVLRNEVMVLPGGLQIAGVDDVLATRMSRPDVEAVLDKLDRERPAILVSHQPLNFDLAAERGVGLMLSGHTHRGQIFPFGVFVRLVYRYVHGFYRRGESTLYVSAGTGEWGPPMRLFTRAEIVRFVLRGEKAPAGD